MTRQMLERVRQGLRALVEAKADERKHLALTDPDARMMPLGRERHVREGYAWEVAADAGLLVGVLTSTAENDTARLEPLLEAARTHEPGGVHAVDADSGYYTSDTVAALAQAGVDTCIPDPHTACDLHRGQPVGTCRAQTQGQVPFTYDAAADLYRCPEGNTLRFERQRVQKGQEVRLYRAEQPCRACPRAAACLVRANTQQRTLAVGLHHALLATLRERFAEPEHVARYHRRGDAIETIFGFLRGVLGYVRWQLRGEAKIASEGQLFAAAYQFRKVHGALGKALRAG
jgi:transposase